MTDVFISPDVVGPKVAVIVASTGRPESVATLLGHLAAQSRAPCQIILSVHTEADLPASVSAWARDSELIVVTGPKGCAQQRNTGLELLSSSSEVVAFFDDDYVPSHYCIERIGTFFVRNPDVVGANGLLLADGANSSGISIDDAETMIGDFDEQALPDYSIHRDVKGLYGCNMAFRRKAMENLCFDERLKFYAWQEDFDFAMQVMVHGRTVQTNAFAGVHLSSKRGRTSGLRFGYSQIINPLYLIRKGTMPTGYGLKLMARNIAANHVRMLRPEPWVDRMGRVKGNWLAFGDAMRGRLEPERIELL